MHVDRETLLSASAPAGADMLERFQIASYPDQAYPDGVWVCFARWGGCSCSTVVRFISAGVGLMAGGSTKEALNLLLLLILPLLFRPFLPLARYIVARGRENTCKTAASYLFLLSTVCPFCPSSRLEGESSTPRADCPLYPTLLYSPCLASCVRYPVHGNPDPLRLRAPGYLAVDSPIAYTFSPWEFTYTY